MKEKIIKLRNDGKTYNEIRKILGCSKSTISYHCKKIKKEYEFIENVDSDIQIEIIELRSNKFTLLEIYNKINKATTKENIRIICKKNNLSFLDRLTEERIKEIREEYVKTKNIKKTARIVGCASETIRKYVNDLKNNKDKISKSKSVIEWRIRVKKKLVEYKGGKCEKCGYDRCIEALEFHHINSNEKDFTISGKSWSYERLKKESDKCILVCSNCHKEIHSENR